MRSGCCSGFSHLEQGNSQGHREGTTEPEKQWSWTHIRKGHTCGKGVCAVLLLVTHQQAPPNNLAGSRYSFGGQVKSVLCYLCMA